jgi:hypothetical protein
MRACRAQSPAFLASRSLLRLALRLPQTIAITHAVISSAHFAHILFPFKTNKSEKSFFFSSFCFVKV